MNQAVFCFLSIATIMIIIYDTPLSVIASYLNKWLVIEGIYV